MTTALDKLLEIAGESLASPYSVSAGDKDDLLALKNEILRFKNGFFAFEAALHVFPTITTEQSWGLCDWNARPLWKADYGGLADDITCFAEDIFGGQFCFVELGISRFDPETGALENVSHNLEEWASKLLSDYDGMVGYNAANAWQAANGSLPSRFRLMPKMPFVVGGTSELTNLTAIDSVRVMKNMGNLARQIHDVPNGSQIKFEIIHRH